MPLPGDLEKEGGTLAAPPILAGAHVLVATLTGYIWEIDPQSGAIVEKYRLGVPLRFPPTVADGWIYCTTQDGRIAAINTGKPELTGWNMWFGDPQHSNLAASR